MEMEIELTSVTKYFSVDMPEEDLTVTVIYIDDDNSVTPEWDYTIADGDYEKLTEELKDEITEKIKELLYGGLVRGY